jgi:hypothetical protein
VEKATAMEGLAITANYQKQGAWTEEECNNLVNLVQRVGKRWGAIQKTLNWSADSCRKKYHGILGRAPNVATRNTAFKRGAWTKEEADILVDLVEQMGKNG